MGAWVKGYLFGWVFAVVISLVAGWYAALGLMWFMEWVAYKLGYKWGSVADGAFVFSIIGFSIGHVKYEQGRAARLESESVIPESVIPESVIPESVIRGEDVI